MQFADPALIVLFLVEIGHLITLYAVLRSRRLNEHAVRLLGGLCLAALGWGVSQMLLRMQLVGIVNNLDAYVLSRYGVYGLLIMAVLFFQLTRCYERKEDYGLKWWGIGAAFLLVGLLLYLNPFSWPDTFLPLGGYVFVRWLVAFGVLVIGWGVFSIASIRSTIITYRRTSSPLHRNRNKYWALAVILAVSSQGLLLGQKIIIGSLLQLLFIAIATCTLLTYALPDLRLAARRTVSYLIMTILTTCIYTGGYFAAQAFFQSEPGYNPITAGVILALALATLFNPLLNLVQRFINRVISGSRYDPNQTLSEYSLSISNILDMELLATVVVGLISEAMEITHGALVTIQYEGQNLGPANLSPESERSGTYRFRPITGMGQELPEGSISANSPLILSLRRERTPLTQYDIDLQPRFHALPPAERAWLSSLNVDVYLPIYAKDELIGLLALGPKISGDRYYSEDLGLLKTLADQTAVALENARLYENLKQRNAENERLNAELKKANVELSRLDQAKSDFINIASHELRTPLTQVIGFNDILVEIINTDPIEKNQALQMTESVRRAAWRLEEIVESMFEVTRLDTRTLDMARMPVILAEVVNTAIENWSQGINERQLTVTAQGISGLPPIIGDPRRLTQVFSHLLQNAIKSTPNGGQIRIIGQMVDSSNGNGNQPSQRYVDITVEDTGIGIAAEELERIFEKFYRVGNVLLHSTGSTKFKGAGPGLGLTIARGIIETHGGRIWAESPGYDEENCPGTKFHVLLPLNSVEEENTQLQQA